MVQTIIEAHSGQLRAEDGAGGGTIFRLTVPGPAGVSWGASAAAMRAHQID
jgi:signal transduction histidine kinase